MGCFHEVNLAPRNKYEAKISGTHYGEVPDPGWGDDDFPFRSLCFDVHLEKCASDVEDGMTVKAQIYGDEHAAGILERIVDAYPKILLPQGGGLLWPQKILEQALSIGLRRISEDLEVGSDD
jgi:hypothetical protein